MAVAEKIAKLGKFLKPPPFFKPQSVRFKEVNALKKRIALELQKRIQKRKFAENDEFAVTLHFSDDIGAGRAYGLTRKLAGALVEIQRIFDEVKGDTQNAPVVHSVLPK